MNVHELVVTGFMSEIEKTALTEDQKDKLKRGLTIGAATGLGVGTAKGLAEKGIESRIKKVVRKGSKLPWAVARGVTSAGAGVAYTLAGLAAMGAFSSKKKKKAK